MSAFTSQQLHELASILDIVLSHFDHDTSRRSQAIDYVIELANLRRRQGTLPTSAVRDAANDLIDAIATPRGRDFMAAWEHACMIFGRYGATPALFFESAGKRCDCGLGPCTGSCVKEQP